MKHVLTKVSHSRHILDGKELESRSYLPHDLMHFAYANVSQSEEGFFASGTNVLREEMVVGMLQGMYKDYAQRGQEFNFQDSLDRLNELLVLQGHQAVDLSFETMEATFAEYAYFYRRWQGMRTGESLVIHVS